ncbi:MAG TPA: endonuclease domain-containing protein [Candidatus Binataceae bacterium]|nr:endonuclease domain-containing protein [Candidatus Binataceae bacterium]
MSKSLRRRMTPQEQKLWAALRRNALNGLHFCRQQVIADFIVDFYYDAARLVLELDSASHDLHAQRDRRRDFTLKSLGIRVLRIPNESIERDFDSIVDWIESEATKRKSGIQPNPQPLPASGRGARSSP